MYDLLIADDEQTILDGLCNIVDWNAMGFEVVKVAQDGKEILDFLERKQVNVILSDIKMTHYSGLDVAKQISARKLNTKVVLMSGYREFDLVREALLYNVKYYLLKPTNLSELKNIFEQIKKELDAENIKYTDQMKNQVRFSEMLSLYKEQFFTDLVMGGIYKKDTIDRRANYLDMEISPALCKLCVATLTIQNDSKFEKTEISAAVRNIIKKNTGKTDYFVIANTNESSLQVIAVDTGFDPGFERKIQTFFSDTVQRLLSVMGAKVTVSLGQIFSSMYEAASYSKPMIAEKGFDDKLKNVMNASDFLRLEKQKDLFLVYINSNNLENAMDLFSNIINELQYMKKDVLCSFIIDLMAGIKKNLEDMGISMAEKTPNYNGLLKTNNPEAIKKWGQDVLKEVCDYVDKYKATLNDNVIINAKNYIRENYNREINLNDVAGHVYLSSIYFSHLFKQKTGENFVDYLIKVRMKKAMELLKNPEYKIYEISEKVGYKNTKYFYKLFKDYTGITPNQYKKMGSEINEN